MQWKTDELQLIPRSVATAGTYAVTFLLIVNQNTLDFLINFKPSFVLKLPQNFNS